MTIEIQRATANQADALTLLAHAAKRHWGYPAEWIVHWQSDLTITSEFIDHNEVFIATIEDKIVGCCALVTTGGLAELEHMWIEPDQMGKGIGRALFEKTRRRALELGFTEFELSADPHAEAFYERMGAQRIGEIPAEMFGQSRVLPRMRVRLGIP